MNTKRLRRACKGARIRFNGDASSYQQAVNAQGIPIGPEILQYIGSHPFRWALTVCFHFRHSELTKTVERHLETQQACLLNDLTDTIQEMQTSAALELGDYWEFDSRTWVVRVL